MANRIEWAFAGSEPPYTNLPELLSPDLLEELSDDGNDARHWGLSTEGIMLYGSLDDLHRWLTAALKDLEEPRRKQRNREIKARLREAGLGKCQHRWQLTEDGYTRTWSTEVDEERRLVLAFFSGTDDWSEEGESTYLQCTECQHVKLVPAGYQIAWDGVIA